jgi:phage FluMu protein Com
MYRNIECPECQPHVILMQIDGFIEGRIRIKCRRCHEYFTVTDEGIIANEKTQMREEDYERMMRK